jgi:predicted RNA methylase
MKQDAITEREYWSGADLVYYCLVDKKRALAFKKAIHKCVSKGDIVVDLGTGTGILALFALEAGAKKVYIVEADKHLHHALEKNFNHKQFKDRVQLIKGDASRVKIPEKVDAVICEMISTGLIDELQIPVMNHIHQFCKPGAKFFPEKMDNLVDLVFSPNTFYGHKLDILRLEYEEHPELWSTQFSKKLSYALVDFTKNNPLNICKRLEVKVERTGIINGIRISNKTFFPDGSTLDFSPAYCMPLILPLQETKVRKGDTFCIHLSYEMCKGLSTMKYDIKRK